MVAANTCVYRTKMINSRQSITFNILYSIDIIIWMSIFTLIEKE